MINLSFFFRETEETHKIADDQRIKIISKAGTKLVNLFEKKNPFQDNCKDEDCPPCNSLDPEDKRLTMCKVNNVCYECKCVTCEKEGKVRCYTGETSRNLHVRSKEHIRDLHMKNKNSWMLKHIEKEHSEDVVNVKFSWRVIRKHSKPLQRQLHEAIRIQNKKEVENLNTKFEYNGQRINRISLSSNTAKLNCRTCGRECDQYEDLMNHNKKFHNRIKCNKCDYQAFGTSDLTEHTKNIHTSKA